MSWDVIEVTGHRTVTITDPGEADSDVTVHIEGPVVHLEVAGTGLQGPPGPAGPSGGAAEETYAFAVPAQVWETAHTLPVAYPGVIALDADGRPVHGDVTFPTPDSVRVTWAWPMAGSLVLTT